MKIDLYQSMKNRRTFISVPKGADISKLELSNEEAGVVGEVQKFKSLNIDASDSRIAMDSAAIIENIQKKGYALHGTKIEFTTL